MSDGLSVIDRARRALDEADRAERREVVWVWLLMAVLLAVLGVMIWLAA